MGFFNGRRRATPGGWYGSYHAAWTDAHPNAWKDGTGQSGCFCAGDVWCTGTPEFDKKWFRANGMDRPRRFRSSPTWGHKGPGEIRLASTLAPGESVAVELDVSTINNPGQGGLD